MNTDLGRKLRSEAGSRAASHPVDVERALLAGVRRYRQKVMAAYAAVTAIVLVLAGTAFLGHLANVGFFTEVTLTAVTVTPAAVSLQPGETAALTARLSYSDGSTGPAASAVWTSSNDRAARVDGAGTVIAIGPGTATISATRSGLSGTSTVTVAAPAVTGSVLG